MGLPITITPALGRFRVRLDDLIIGDTSRAVVVHEAGHDPAFYVPRSDMRMDLLVASPRKTDCPWKGQASYFSAGGQENIIWSYEAPIETVAEIAGYMAFYPAVTVEKI
jgi:uncharacterized protein (DUF427 family)